MVCLNTSLIFGEIWSLNRAQKLFPRPLNPSFMMSTSAFNTNPSNTSIKCNVIRTSDVSISILVTKLGYGDSQPNLSISSLLNFVLHNCIFYRMNTELEETQHELEISKERESKLEAELNALKACRKQVGQKKK